MDIQPYNRARLGTQIRPLRPSSLQEAVDAYLDRLDRTGKRENTLRRYEPDLRAFIAWAGDYSLSDIDTADIEDGFIPAWIRAFKSRNDRREPKPATVRAVYCVLGSFYRYLSNSGYLMEEDGRPKRNPMLSVELPKLRQRRNDYLRPHEDEALLDLQLDRHEEVLVWFLRFTGLRLSEALALRIRDVDVDDRTIYVNDSKSESGIREVPIAPELVPCIRGWLEHLAALDLRRPSGYFLCTTRAGRGKGKDGVVRTYEPGGPMKAQQVGKIVRRVGDRAGVERLTPHRLRRTFGSSLLNAGLRMEVVSELLGHSNVSITQQAYAQLSSDTVRREMLEALSGRRRSA